MKGFILTTFLLLLMIVPVSANQEGIVVRLAPVHAKANSTSQQVGQLTAGTQVNIFGRKGGWKEIFSEEKAIIGWVRSYQVRESSAAPVIQTDAKSDSRGFLSGLASFSRKASSFFKSDSGSTSSGTATIGVRGLSEAEIKSAVADFVEREKMKRYASKPSRMPLFVSQGGLSTQAVKYLAEN